VFVALYVAEGSRWFVRIADWGWATEARTEAEVEPMARATIARRTGLPPERYLVSVRSGADAS
jgi:hypothetical protein